MKELTMAETEMVSGGIPIYANEVNDGNNNQGPAIGAPVMGPGTGVPTSGIHPLVNPPPEPQDPPCP